MPKGKRRQHRTWYKESRKRGRIKILKFLFFSVSFFAIIIYSLMWADEWDRQIKNTAIKKAKIIKTGKVIKSPCVEGRF